MKKVLLTTCAVVCAAVTASAQGVGTVKLINWESAQYLNAQQEKQVEQASQGFLAIASRAAVAGALKHQQEQAEKEAASAEENQEAQNTQQQTQQEAQNVAKATTAEEDSPATQPAKKKTLWDYIVSAVPTDGHCSTQPFK